MKPLPSRKRPASRARAGSSATFYHYDCRHFRGEKPCGVAERCEGCGSYEPVTRRILIIKLAARGDVLRTTPLLRAFRREALESVNLAMNSDAFIFDQEIMAQVVEIHARIAEVPVPTRYFAQASSASFAQSVRYGLSILWVLLKYLVHKSGLRRQLQFESLERRYAAPRADELPQRR